jgi:RNA recognition motif-containing protein
MKMYVSNLSFHTTEEILKDLFSKVRRSWFRKNYYRQRNEQTAWFCICRNEF